MHNEVFEKCSFDFITTHNAEENEERQIITRGFDVAPSWSHPKTDELYTQPR